MHTGVGSTGCGGTAQPPRATGPITRPATASGCASTATRAGWRLIDGPYYGGLQMNMEFQQMYGPELLRSKGTANHWTPLEQIWVAERAYRELGYQPWPNTARMCGLL